MRNVDNSVLVFVCSGTNILKLTCIIIKFHHRGTKPVLSVAEGTQRNKKL